jgi:hypothetical protein
MENLHKDEDWQVRMNVAKNPNCPQEILEKLSQDTSRDVRQAVLCHPNCPPQVIVHNL